MKEEVLPIAECPSRRLKFYKIFFCFYLQFNEQNYLVFLRGGSTFSLNQERDELVLFGGEYYNGAKVEFNKLNAIILKS